MSDIEMAPVNRAGMNVTLDRVAQSGHQRLVLHRRRFPAADRRRLYAAVDDLDRDVYGACHLVAVVLRTDQLHRAVTAAFFGIGMYIMAAGIDLVPYPVLILASG